ncbi:MAG: translocation and assembly module lipoprotein TamL [Flavisolibacter sp.]
MKSKKQHPFFFIISCLLFWACSNTRHLPANEKLYVGATVAVSGPHLAIKQKKVLRADLNGLTRPRPNSKLLGARVKLAIYNLFRNKKPNSFFGKLRDKWGEPPVLLSQLDLDKNIKILQNHLENKGFFRAKVTGDSTVRRKKAWVRYKAQTGDQYVINTVHFPADSSDLSVNIQHTVPKTLLKKGAPFDLDVIKGERLRIDGYLKEHGFYYFSPDFLLVKTDSTIGNHLVDMYVTVKPDMPKPAGQIYKINEVYIYSNYSLNTAKEDTSLQNSRLTNGYHLVDKAKKFKPGLFQEAMQFSPGDVYNRTEHNLTLNRLINLDLFKFVKNRFEPVTDTPKLNVFYYLTPMPSKSLRTEFTVTNRSNNLNGSEITFSWRDRNIFNGGEHLGLSAYVGSDVQFSGALSGYNTYRTGAEMNLTVPHILIPFRTLRYKGGFAPRTAFRLGYDILNRKSLYTLNSYRFEYGYIAKRSLVKTHEFNPVAVDYVQALNVSRKFDSLVHTDTILAKTIQSQFILGSNYQFNYNEVVNGLQKLNSYYFNGRVDFSGNVAGLLTGADYKAGKEKLIYKAPFAQYMLFEADGRYYRKVGLNSSWANRVIMGFGYPYGNSVEVPYIKQFFVGGNNSLRGFRSRGVGPGTYRSPNAETFLPDQTGDIKFEFNSEFRPKISGPLYGALFFDAGNVWLFNDSTYTKRPGGQFTSKFLSQLAMDVGAGLRMDITIFVIRLDVGIPLRKPWEKNPWVANQVSLGDANWRKQNLVYNLAIGYPF